MAPDQQHIDETDRGLLYDVGTLVSRRRALGILGGAGLAGVLAACGSSGTAAKTSAASSSSASSSSASTSSTAAEATADAADVVEVPDETAGPYPGDGSNGPDVLAESGIVRGDIRRSFGSSTTQAEGIPLTIALTVRDAGTGAALK